MLKFRIGQPIQARALVYPNLKASHSRVYFVTDPIFVWIRFLDCMTFAIDA